MTNILTPTITSVSPTVVSGDAAFTLTVTGTNFVSKSVVYFNVVNGASHSLKTTFVSATQLTAVVPVADMHIAGAVNVMVRNPRPTGAFSNAVSLSITGNPLPVITSISPLQVLIDSAFTLTVTGSNFIPQSVVHFGASKLATTYVSSTQLTAVVPANALEQRIGAKKVFVSNPAPCGGNSNLKTFVVYGNLIKVISSNLNYDFTLTVSGDAYTDAVVIPANVVNYDLGAVLSGSDLNVIQTELEKLVVAGDIVVVSTAPLITYDIEAAGVDPVSSTPVFPSYTTMQKLALANPKIGTTVFDTTLGDLSICTGITTGQVQTLFLEVGGGNPYQVCAGPDGNVWFTNNLAGYIGRITPSGVITRFPVPTVSSNLGAICLGPDGNLWFTEYAGNIGRITPSGVVTEFPIPTTSGLPVGICLGPDGNLWFTEYNGNNIGRITPAGVVTEFPVTSANANPISIAKGPDGNLWFTEVIGTNIGQITPSGAIVEFAVSDPNGYPYGICTGPDGNIWFVDYESNNIGRLQLTSSTPVWQTINTGSSVNSSLSVNGTVSATNLSSDSGNVSTDGAGDLMVVGSTSTNQLNIGGSNNPLGEVQALVLGQTGNDAAIWFHPYIVTNPSDLTFVGNGVMTSCCVEIKTTSNQTYTLPGQNSGGWYIIIAHTSDSTGTLSVNGVSIAPGQFTHFLMSQQTGNWYVKA